MFIFALYCRLLETPSQEVTGGDERSRDQWQGCLMKRRAVRADLSFEGQSPAG